MLIIWRTLDAFNLLMIEQPLSHDDIYQHGALQSQLQTRICLDESVKSASDLQVALQVGAIGILNLKPARVGGFSECLEIYRICVEMIYRYGLAGCWNAALDARRMCPLRHCPRSTCHRTFPRPTAILILI